MRSPGLLPQSNLDMPLLPESTLASAKARNFSSGRSGRVTPESFRADMKKMKITSDGASTRSTRRKVVSADTMSTKASVPRLESMTSSDRSQRENLTPNDILKRNVSSLARGGSRPTKYVIPDLEVLDYESRADDETIKGGSSRMHRDDRDNIPIVVEETDDVTRKMKPTSIQPSPARTNLAQETNKVSRLTEATAAAIHPTKIATSGHNKGKAFNSNPVQAINPTGLSWRSDPSTSFSDWTLEVVALRGDVEISRSEYHCHSNVLAWGPRKCEKFVQLFQERMGKVPPSKITEIELQEAIALVFPMLLDFLYCETALPLTSERACSLYELADQFGTPQLLIAIQSFVEKSLNLTQSIGFLSAARRYENKTKVEKLVLFANSKLCAYLVKNPEAATHVPPELLAHMLHERSQCVKVLKGEDPRKYSGEWESQRSQMLSVVVATCCHEAINSSDPLKELTRKVFLHLIHSRHLPALDAEASLTLLHIDNVTSQREDDVSASSDQSVGKSDQKFNSLERRSLEALASSWRSLYLNKRKRITEQLALVSPHVLAELLIIVSGQYEERVKRSERSTVRMQDLLQQLSPRIRSRRRDDDTIDDVEDEPEPCPKSVPETLVRGQQWCTDFVDLVRIYADNENYEDDSYTNPTYASPLNRR